MFVVHNFNQPLSVCMCVCVCVRAHECFAVLCVYRLRMFYFVVLHVCVSHPAFSCRKQSSWRESGTGSTPRSPSTPSQTPRSSRLTSTRLPRVWPRRPTGLSPIQLRASPSHRPHQHPRHQPQRAGLCLGSWRSRESRGPTSRAKIQKMVLTSVYLRMNRLRQTKPQQRHRVRPLTGFYIISPCVVGFDLRFIGHSLHLYCIYRYTVFSSIG